MHGLSTVAPGCLAPAPGLLRVISWTLNGLDVCTQNAVVRTSEDGQAHNTFWLTKRGTGGLGLTQGCHNIQGAAGLWLADGDAPAALHSHHAVLRRACCNAMHFHG